MQAGLLMLLLTGCDRQKDPVFDLDTSLLDAHAEAFIPHAGDGPFDTYLAVNLPYPPARKLLREVEARFAVKLKSRGEAHITVITPIEYQRLAQTLDIDAINDLAAEHIQRTAFEISCLGRATATLAGGPESTYFLVVHAPGLEQLRRRIRDEFVRVGGNPSAFDPGSYSPHVTLGFTSRDLHERDGTVKDESTCVAEVRLAENPQ